MKGELLLLLLLNYAHTSTSGLIENPTGVESKRNGGYIHEDIEQYDFSDFSTESFAPDVTHDESVEEKKIPKWRVPKKFKGKKRKKNEAAKKDWAKGTNLNASTITKEDAKTNSSDLELATSSAADDALGLAISTEDKDITVKETDPAVALEIPKELLPISPGGGSKFIDLQTQKVIIGKLKKNSANSLQIFKYFLLILFIAFL